MTTDATQQITYRPLPKYKYQLVKDVSVTVSWLRGRHIETANGLVSVNDGILSIKANYCWDGSSGLTRDSSSNMRGSLYHDVLYQMLRDGLLKQSLRPKIDELFLAMLKADGMSRLRLRYFGLIRRLGGLTSKRQDPPETLTAP